jgi:DNA-binding cell septation regulator SpoVG
MVIGKKKLTVRNIKHKDGTRGVFISFPEWKQVKQEIEKLKKISLQSSKKKKSVFDDVKDALEEVALIKQGKLKPKPAKDFLREL